MTRQTRKLIIALGLLGAALAALGGIKWAQNKPKDDDLVDEPIAKEVVLTNYALEDLRLVRVENAEEILAFTSADGENWQLDGVPSGFIPNMTALTSAVRNASSLSSRTTIAESPSNERLADYGLANPVAKVVVKDREGNTSTVLFGAETPSGTGRYARSSDGGAVVLLPTYTSSVAFQTQKDYRDFSLPTINPQAIFSLAYRSQGVEFITEPKGEETRPYVTMVSDLQITSPWQGTYSIDENELQKVLSEEAPLPTQVAAWFDEANPSDPALGLNPNTADYIRIADAEGNSLNLLLGATTPEGQRYARLENSNGPVFLLDASTLKLLDVPPFRFTRKFVFLASIMAVEDVIVRSEGKEFTLHRTERGESDNTKDDRFLMNGREVPRDDFTEVYQKMIAIMREGVVEETLPIGQPEAIITAHHVSQEVEPATVRFWPYDEVYYRVAVNDDPIEFLVGRYQVKQLITALDELAAFGT